MRIGFLDWPLRLKLAVLLALASLLPLALSAYIDIHHAREQLLTTTSALLSARGDQLVDELDTFNEGYVRTARKFARLPAIAQFFTLDERDRERLRPDIDAMLAVQPATDPYIRGAALLDDSGTVRLATEREIVGERLNLPEAVRNVLAGRETISNIYVGEPNVASVPSVAYLAPIRDSSQRTVAAVVIFVRAAALWKITKSSNGLAGAGSFAVLFDQLGIRIGHTYNDDIVFHPGGALDARTKAALVGERRFGDKTQELLDQVRAFPEQFERARAEVPAPNVFRGFAPANRKWNYGVARRFKTVPWTAFYMVPEESLLAQMSELSHSRAGFAAVIIVIALMVGALCASAILRPIQLLADAADSLARGELGARALVRQDDELGQLAVGFNAMAARIEEQARALKHTNEELERKIEQRTAELVGTSQALLLENAERKRVELSLRESEESLATTLNSIGDAVIATDVQIRIVRMNPVAEQLTGWQLADAIGKPLSEVFRIFHEDTRQPADSPAERVLREGAVVGLANHTALLSRDGRQRPIADSGAPIRDSKGQITGVVLVFRDQSEERSMQELRIERVRLEAQNQRIQEANRMKSEFLANMSHELRTPLNAIIGFAALLHDGEVTPDMPEHQEFLGDVLTSARHLLQLINDILDLSKVEAGQLRLHPEAVELPKLVNEVLGILRTTAASKQIRLESQVEASLTGVVLDAARLKQVLYNYVSNALKFTSSGGRVLVRIRAEDEDTFRLEVEDTGIGIAPEDIGRLFSEFQQLDGGIAKRHGGTGLGLALTKRLVEAQGGRVGVHSRLSEGSCFHALLPRKPRVAPARALHDPTSPGPPPQERS